MTRVRQGYDKGIRRLFGRIQEYGINIRIWVHLTLALKIKRQGCSYKGVSL